MPNSMYAYRIHGIKMSRDDSLRVTGNIAIFAALYTLAGGVMSFVLYYLFDVYNPEKREGMEWEKKGLAFQVFDVVLEIAIIAVGAFWLVYFVNTSAPIIPVRHGLQDFVDSYTSGMFFMSAIFIFMTDLTNKLRYLFQTALGEMFDHYFPEQGSILDGSLCYSQRQKERFRGRA
uniref:Uncharacterized protein n=1 Tax=viral metagenome TaxID=1070528 RepID=A0A6C0HL36_9ZZZZ